MTTPSVLIGLKMEAIELIAWSSILLMLALAITFPHIFLVSCILVWVVEHLVIWAVGPGVQDDQRVTLHGRSTQTLSFPATCVVRRQPSGSSGTTLQPHTAKPENTTSPKGARLLEKLGDDSSGSHESLPENWPGRPRADCEQGGREGTSEAGPDKQSVPRRSRIPKPVSANRRPRASSAGKEAAGDSRAQKRLQGRSRSCDNAGPVVRSPRLRSLSASREQPWRRECAACSKKASHHRPNSQERAPLRRSPANSCTPSTSKDDDERAREPDTQRRRSNSESLKARGKGGRGKSEPAKGSEENGRTKPNRLAAVRGSQLSLAGSCSSGRNRKVSWGSTSELGCGHTTGASHSCREAHGVGRGVRIICPGHQKAISLENLHQPTGGRVFRKSLHKGSREDLGSLGKSGLPKHSTGHSQSVEDLRPSERIRRQDHPWKGSCGDLLEREQESSSAEDDEEGHWTGSLGTLNRGLSPRLLKDAGPIVDSWDGLHVGGESFHTDILYSPRRAGHSDEGEGSTSQEDDTELTASTINLHYNVGPIVHLDSSSDVQIGNSNTLHKDPSSPAGSPQGR